MKILRAMKPDMAKRFRDFYESQNMSVPFATFITLPTILKLFIYVKFFDTVYGYGIVFDRYGYCIFASDLNLTGWHDYREPVASHYHPAEDNIVGSAEEALLRIITIITDVPF